jgi:uncharacterized protein (DUF3820 family)
MEVQPMSHPIPQQHIRQHPTCRICGKPNRTLPHHGDGKVICINCARNKKPTITPLSFTRLPFGQYQGQTLDQVPLAYLDWLAGQNWLYGDFKKRLHKYINKPCIQHELAEQFPDPDDDSRAPLFFSADPGTDSVTCNYTCDMRHRWHGQPMPQDEEARDYTPRPIRKGQRWAWLADLWLAIESAHFIHELPACQGLKDLFAGLPEHSINKVRIAYQTARDQTEPPERTTWPIAIIHKPETPDIEVLSQTFSRGRGKKRHLACVSAGRRPVE